MRMATADRRVDIFILIGERHRFEAQFEVGSDGDDKIDPLASRAPDNLFAVGIEFCHLQMSVGIDKHEILMGVGVGVFADGFNLIFGFIFALVFAESNFFSIFGNIGRVFVRA